MLIIKPVKLISANYPNQVINLLVKFPDLSHEFHRENAVENVSSNDEINVFDKQFLVDCVYHSKSKIYYDRNIH